MIKEEIKDVIYEIRGIQVILVSDLAKLCGYKNGTKTVNLTIKRNIDMFSNKDYFQLTEKESELFWFQRETKKQEIETRGGKFDKPFVLTLNGIKTLSTILKSKKSNLIINEIIDYMTSKNSYQLINTNNEFFPENQEKIENLIYEIDDKQVMFDFDLAILYGCKNGTKDINKAVKRNLDRFPTDFYFQLNEEQLKLLSSRFQFGTLNKSSNNRGNNIKYMPYVFTEEGVSMLASVLRTENASIVSVNIMRAFVKTRHFIQNNRYVLENVINIFNKLYKHDQKFIEQNQKNIEYDKKFDILFSKFKSKEQKELLFFDGQLYDAYSKLVDILELAKNELIIIDTYADKLVLDMISNLNTKVTLITKENQNLKKN